MALPGNLPKVTQYVKNVGKSVAYTTVEYFKDTMPETKDFLETNQELFKEITVAAKDYKRTLIAAEKSIKRSKIWEAGAEIKKSIFDSIKTGKFYDPDREEYYGAKSMGMDFDDDFGGLNDFDIGTDDEYELSDSDKSALRVSNAVHDATVAQSTIIAKSADYLAQIQKDSTKLLFTQNERMYNQVTAGMSNLYNAMDNMMKFMMGPLTTHMKNSEDFYRSTSESMKTITESVKEIAEMQRNLYKREQQMYKEGAFQKVGGIPDLKEYAKQVKKNFFNEVPFADMIFGNTLSGEEGNQWLRAAANPLGFLAKGIVKLVVPMAVKQSLESFDLSFKGIFANLMGKANYLGKNDYGILGMLGSIFGVKPKDKRSLNPANYEKGPVPFDGITKKSIVEVIPGHLARIEAALVGKDERIFDYETGKWVSAKDVIKNWQNLRKNSVNYAFSDVNDELRREINRRKNSSNDKTRKEGEALENAAHKIMNKAYDDEHFLPYNYRRVNGMKEAPWDYYGVDKQTFLTVAKLLVGDPKHRKKGATGLSASIMEEKDRMSRQLERFEQSGSSQYRALFNGQFNYDTKLGAKNTGNGTGITGIAGITDSYNKDIFWYLRGIYASLEDIRNNGGGFGGDGGGKRKSRKQIMSNLERSLKSTMNKATSEQEITKISQDTINEISGALEDDELRRAQEEDTTHRVRNFVQNSKLNDKAKKFLLGIGKIFTAPGEAIAGIITMADTRIYEMMFGKKNWDEDEDDDNPKSIFGLLKSKITSGFNKIFDGIDTAIEKIKEKLGIEKFSELWERFMIRFGLDKKVEDIKKKYWNPTRDKIKEKVKNAWRGFKGSIDRTLGYDNGIMAKIDRKGAREYWYRKNYNDIVDDFMAKNFDNPQGRPIESVQAMDDDDLADYLADRFGDTDMSASGGRVLRRGLTVVSPGETIIPAGGRGTQRAQLAAEKAFARKHGFRGLRYMAGGSANAVRDGQDLPKEGRIIQFPGSKKEKDVIRKIIGEVLGDDKSGIPNIIASGIIGGGVSLLTGMVGGPLLGAAVGASVGIIQNSQTIQNLLFGKEVVDENGNKSREGGVIPKSWQEKFNKYFPDAKDWGLAGGVLGMLVPGVGIIGGMALGAMGGFVKNTEGFQDFMFGPKGKDGTRDDSKALIKQKYIDYMKKHAPGMLIGAAGAALLGPFGFLPNVVLGSAIGLGVQTETFKDALLGKVGDDGKRHGGIIGALKDGFVTPIIQRGKILLDETKRFAQKNIFDPIKRFMKPLGQMIKNGIKNVIFGTKDFLARMAQKLFFEPVQDWLEHKVFRGAFNIVSKVLRAPVNIAKGVIAAPFRLLGGIGDNIRAGQISRGSADDMTAEERLEFRRSHRGRFVGRFFNPLSTRDKQRTNDEMLAGLRGNGEAGLKQMQDMKKSLQDLVNLKNAVGGRASESVRKAIEWLSDKLNHTNLQTLVFIGKSSGPVDDTAYGVIGYANVHRVNVLISKLDSESKKSEIYNIIDNQWREAIHKKCGAAGPKGVSPGDDLIDDILTSPEFDKLLDQVIADLAEVKDTSKAKNRLLGNLRGLTGIKTNNDARRMIRNLDTEINAAKADQTPEGKAAQSINTVIDARAKDIIDIISKILHVVDKEGRYAIPTSGESAAESATDIVAEAGSSAAEATRDMLTGRKSRQWSTEDEQWLLRNYKIIGGQKCADHLGRSVGAVRSKYKKLVDSGASKAPTFGDDMRASFDKAKAWAVGVGAKVKGIPGKLGEALELGSLKNLRTGGRAIVENSKDYNGILVDTYAGPDGKGTDEIVKNAKYRKAVKMSVKDADERRSELKAAKEDRKNRMKIMFGRVKDWAKLLRDKAKAGIFGMLNTINDSSTIIGKIFKGIKVVAFGALIASAMGHVSEWWKQNSIGEKVGNFFKRIWVGKDGNGGLKKFFTGLWDGFKSIFPNLFGEGKIFGVNGFFDKHIIQPIGKFIDDAKEHGLGKAIGIRLKGLWDVFTDGLVKFKDNILKPIWNWISPRIELLAYNIWESITSGKARARKIELASLTSMGAAVGTYTDAEGNVHIASVNNENYNISESGKAKRKMTFSKEGRAGAKSRKSNFTDTATGNDFTYVVHDKEYNQGIEQYDIKCETSNEVLSYNATNGTYSYGYAFQGNNFNRVHSSIISSSIFFMLIDKCLEIAGPNIQEFEQTETGFLDGTYVPGFGAASPNRWAYYLAQGISEKSLFESVRIHYFDDATVVMVYGIPSGQVAMQEACDYFFFDTSRPEVWPFILGSEFKVEGGYYTRNGSFIATPNRDSTLSIDKSGNISTSYSRNSESESEYDERLGSRSARRRSGKGHLYMNDPGISNLKYGNSTFGQAGCGPVAATNMINNVAPGAMNALTAATYGRYYQTADGGTTPEYFTDIFSRAGIRSSQTSNKSDILSSVKGGNPAVLLGRSSGGAGTPFGPGNHYINLMGVDGRGNAIVEDPDLPTSRNKYPLSRVLNDTITGITVGKSRSGKGPANFDYVDFYNGAYKINGGLFSTSSTSSKSSSSSSYSFSSGSDTISVEPGDADITKLHMVDGTEDEVRAHGWDPNAFREFKIGGGVHTASEENVWRALRAAGVSEVAAAGMMSNWYYESGMKTCSIEAWGSDVETFKKCGGFSMCNLHGGMDAWYPVMKQIWLNFRSPEWPNGVTIAENYYHCEGYPSYDGHYYPGIGLAGWTGPQCQELIAFAISCNQPWDSVECQIGYLMYKKIGSGQANKDIFNSINSMTNPEDAARRYYRVFEMPTGSQESENGHAARAYSIYTKYHGVGGSSRKDSISGYARRGAGYSRSGSMTNYASGKANSIIKSHGMSGTNGSYYSTGAYSGSSSGSARYSGGAGSVSTPTKLAIGSGGYSGSLSTIINLLSVIADNTEALNGLQSSLAGRGANIDPDTLKAAAKNAKKYSDEPMMAIFNSGNGRGDDSPSSSTQQIVAAMEILARG